MKKQLFLSAVLLVASMDVLARYQGPSAPTKSNTGGGSRGNTGGGGGTPPPANGGGSQPAPSSQGTSSAAAKTVAKYQSDLADLLAGAVDASGLDVKNANKTSAAYKAGQAFAQTGQAQ